MGVSNTSGIKGIKKRSWRCCPIKISKADKRAQKIKIKSNHTNEIAKSGKSGLKSSKNVERGVPQKAQNGAGSSSDGDAAASGIDESDKGERIGDINH